MGKVSVKVTLINYEDVIAVKLGVMKKEDIRSLKIEGLVDTGATMLSIPKNVFEKLGLSFSGREVTATYANGKKEKRIIARGVLIQINGREAEKPCLFDGKPRGGEASG